MKLLPTSKDYSSDSPLLQLSQISLIQPSSSDKDIFHYFPTLELFFNYTEKSQTNQLVINSSSLACKCLLTLLLTLLYIERLRLGSDLQSRLLKKILPKNHILANNEITIKDSILFLKGNKIYITDKELQLLGKKKINNLYPEIKDVTQSTDNS